MASCARLAIALCCDLQAARPIGFAQMCPAAGMIAGVAGKSPAPL
jgi:hypothetical protein